MTPKSRQFALLAGVIVVAGGLAGWWILTAGRAANEGFDITDEGYYLLSYRWWNSNPLALTGVQYLYGPVFEWLGYDIVRLRLFRLLTVVVVHLIFGYSFMRWLRGRRPGAAPTKLWELAGMAVILAAGGMCYSWLPQSPGYNDVVLLGALTLVSCVLWMATAVDRGRTVPFWVLVVAGLVIGAMVLAKWTSVVVIGLIVVAALIVLAGQGLRAVARGVGLALAGLAVAALVVQLFVVRLNVAVPGIMTVNRFIADTSYSPTALLHVYWSTGLNLLGRTLRDHGILLVAAAVAVIARWRWLRVAAGVLVLVAFALSVRRVVADGAAVGGSGHTSRYTVTLLAAVLVALVTAVAAVVAGRLRLTDRSVLSRENARGWVVLGLLVVLPMVQAFGTNNPLYTIGFNAFAAWAAVMIAVVTGIWATPIVARATVGIVAVASLVAVASIAYTGPVPVPLSVGRARAADHGGVPAGVEGPLRRAAGRAELLQAGDRAPAVSPAGRSADPGVRQDGRDRPDAAGEAGRRGLGRAEGTVQDRGRDRGGLPERPPWGASRPPIIILNRPISDVEVTALRACGLDFQADYALLAPAKDTIKLQVYVPRAERAAQKP